MSPTQHVGEVPCPTGKALGACSTLQCWMLMSKQGREEAGTERARASPEGCWAARSPSAVLRCCLRGSRSPCWVHNVLCLLLGVPEGGRDAQAGEAARQADSAEDNPPPGRLQGLPQPPEVQEAEGIHPLGCHTPCPPKPRLGPLPACSAAVTRPRASWWGWAQPWERSRLLL